MKKRFLSLLTAVAIGCTSVAMPAFAEAGADVSNVYTFEDYNPSTKFELPTNWTDKNGYTEPDSDSNKGKLKTGTELYARKGVFGKPSDDTAYDITTLYRPEDRGVFISQWYDTRYNMAANLEGRRYIKASSEVAIDSFRSTRFISIQFYNKTANKWLTIERLIEMVPGNTDGDYTLKIGGETSDYAIPDNKWIKFDLVLDTQTQKTDVYINGTLVKSGVDFGITLDFATSRLNSMIFGQYAVPRNEKGEGTYEAHTYLDNVSYLLTNTKPTVEKYIAPDVIDFQNYNGDLPQGFNYSTKAYQSFGRAVSPSNQTLSKYTGLRGKDQSDISWRIASPETKDKSDEYQSYRWYTNLDASSYNMGFIKFSTEFCMEGASMTRGIAIQTTHNTGWTETDLIKIEKKNGEQVVTVGGGTSKNGDNRVTTDGQVMTLDLPMSVIMKIDVVINRIDKIFDLYINGEKVANGVSMNASYISNVGQVILYAQQKWVGSDVYNGVYGSRNCFPASDTYFDNMEIGRYYSYPAVESYTSPSVTVMTEAQETVEPVEGMRQFGHWVPLKGYDSKYYYYAESVSMPADNATRAYKATFGKATINDAANTTIITNGNLVEVKNGAVNVYGKDIAVTVPTGEKFKLSFLFDVLNKSYNVYVNDEAIAVDVKFETNNAGQPIEEFSGIENFVTAYGQAATVSAKPVASGAFTKLPEYAKFYELTKNGTTVNAKVLSSYLSGRMILATYGSDGAFKRAQIGNSGDKILAITKDDADTAVFMLWDWSVLSPLMRSTEIK